MALVADSLPEIVSPPANILVALWDDIARPIIVSAIRGTLIAKHGGLWTIQVPLHVSPTKTCIIQRCVPHSLVVHNPHDAITPDDAALTCRQRQSELPPDLLYPDSLLMAQWPDEMPHHTFWAAEWLPIEQPAPTPSTDPLAIVLKRFVMSKRTSTMHIWHNISLCYRPLFSHGRLTRCVFLLPSASRTHFLAYCYRFSLRE
jgi:hypothetical protein